jgi:hypothetical protein
VHQLLGHSLWFSFTQPKSSNAQCQHKSLEAVIASTCTHASMLKKKCTHASAIAEGKRIDHIDLWSSLGSHRVDSPLASLFSFPVPQSPPGHRRWGSSLRQNFYKGRFEGINRGDYISMEHQPCSGNRFEGIRAITIV